MWGAPDEQVQHNLGILPVGVNSVRGHVFIMCDMAIKKRPSSCIYRDVLHRWVEEQRMTAIARFYRAQYIGPIVVGDMTTLLHDPTVRKSWGSCRRSFRQLPEDAPCGRAGLPSIDLPRL